MIHIYFVSNTTIKLKRNYIVPILVLTPFLPSHLRGAFFVALHEAKNKITNPNTIPFFICINNGFELCYTIKVIKKLQRKYLIS